MQDASGDRGVLFWTRVRVGAGIAGKRVVQAASSARAMRSPRRLCDKRMQCWMDVVRAEYHQCESQACGHTEQGFKESSHYA